MHTKVQRQFTGKRITFSANGAGMIGYVSAEKIQHYNLNSYLAPYTKLTENGS